MIILVFGPLKDLLRLTEIKWPLPAPVTGEELRRQLETQFPALQGFHGQIRFTRNQEFATASTFFYDGDEVALIPPVSGG